MSKFLPAHLVLAVAPAHAEIHEVNSFRDSRVQVALSSVDASTWVIFDLDNTLIHPRTMIGSAQWSDYMRVQALAAGQSSSDANAFQHSAFARVQSQIEVKPTEVEAASIVRGVQPRAGSTFALTARAEAIADVTTAQIVSVGFNFEGSAPRGESRFHSGVLFAGGVAKGELLKRVISDSAVKPRQILFFDDRLDNLESVGSALSEAGIKFIGYRFGAVDKEVENFRSDIASVQWLEFKRTGRVLSDAEALGLMTSH